MTKSPGLPSKSIKPTTDKAQSKLTPKILLEESHPKYILLVEDPESTYRERFVEKYLQKFSANNARTQERFDGRTFGDMQFKLFYESAYSLSLFAEDKLIIVTHFDKLNAAMAQKVIEIAEKKISNVSFIFSGQPLQERSVARKKIALIGSILTFTAPSGAEFRRFIQREFASYGYSNVPDNVQELIQSYSDGSVDAATHQIKLVSLYGEPPVISIDDVKVILKANASADTYTFLDLLFSGRVDRATLQLSDVLNNGGNIFGLISLASKTSFQMGVFHSASAMGFGVERIRQGLNLSPWIGNKISQSIRKISPTQIAKISASLLKADIRLKSRSVMPIDIMQEVISG